MTLFKILKRAVIDFILVVLIVVLITPFTSFHGVLAEAEGFEEASTEFITYPYTKTFTLSAYYSPLPCQNRYVTGSYESDIYLNGSGVNGADGTAVYAGMIAAPGSYAFGTKMYIPGVGITAVHDRGGAILASNGEDGVYDRLDIWMGYGDTGLQRALNWGKRTLDITVYGINDALLEDVSLDGYVDAEAIANDCVVEEYVSDAGGSDSYVYEEEIISVVEEEEVIQEIDYSSNLESNLQLGDEGQEVLALQTELNKLNFYKGELHGIYNELTEHAVFKFQQSQYLVGDEDSLGAGIFGSKTRDRLNEIISARNYTKVLVAKVTSERLDGKDPVMVADAEFDEKSIDEVGDDNVEVEHDEKVKYVYLTSELSFRMVSNDVKKLQKFLLDQGYFQGYLTTDYFGEVTLAAVIDFQLNHGIIASADDFGAGRVGPGTLSMINSYF